MLQNVIPAIWHRCERACKDGLLKRLKKAQSPFIPSSQAPIEPTSRQIPPLLAKGDIPVSNYLDEVAQKQDPPLLHFLIAGTRELTRVRQESEAQPARRIFRINVSQVHANPLRRWTSSRHAARHDSPTAYKSTPLDTLPRLMGFYLPTYPGLALSAFPVLRGSLIERSMLPVRYGS